MFSRNIGTYLQTTGCHYSEDHSMIFPTLFNFHFSNFDWKTLPKLVIFESKAHDRRIAVKEQKVYSNLDRN
jgi:hypothetical protein